jgi:hypothetical protein
VKDSAAAVKERSCNFFQIAVGNCFVAVLALKGKRDETCQPKIVAMNRPSQSSVRVGQYQACGGSA